MRISIAAIILTGILASFIPASLAAQPGSPLVFSGIVTDAETRQPLPYVTISVPGVSVGAITDEQGRFTLKVKQAPKELKFSALGYRTQLLPVKELKPNAIEVALEPETRQLKEVTVKKPRYRNKNNPAVELIQQVIAHRDQNRVESMTTFSEERYEKTLIGLSQVPDKLKNNRALRSLRFVLDNADTTKLDGVAVAPIYLQEDAIDLYSRKEPKARIKYVKASQAVKFPGYLQQEGMNQALAYMNQDVDLYDNYVVLLTNHFMSPIANGAPMFYRYYPMDTTVVNGVRVIRMEFYPRNKLDMMLQGELFITLDSTYALTRATFTVNPEINLNWVKSLELDQTFERLPNGRWYCANEDYRMNFGLNKRGIGLFGQRVISHRAPTVDTPLPDSLFRDDAEIVYLPDALTMDSTYWNAARHTPLTAAEAATYGNMDSLQRTRLFKTTAELLLIAIVGYVPLSPSVDLGPVNTAFAFNPVEGSRFRLGLRTASGFSKRVQLDGYAAYGLRDERWKFGLGATVALGNTTYNSYPLNRLRANISRDVRIPGQELQALQANNILTSFVRGVNDKFVYYDRYGLQYEREFLNHFSYTVGFERQEQRPAGALTFDRLNDPGLLNEPVIASKAYLQLRYAPGEKFFQTTTYRQRIDVDYIAQLRYAKGFSGVHGSQYDFHELTASFYKFSNLPPIGYNYLYIEAGGVFGRVPYPLLTIHRANQTYVYQLYSYNLMNFMEFISDRYVALNVDHNFYGFFLNKIPLVRRLKLREVATFKMLYGSISNENQPREGSNLFRFPTYADGRPISYSLEARPYMEASIGITNIFKILRIDVVRRFNYLDHPFVSKYGIRGQIQLYF